LEYRAYRMRLKKEHIQDYIEVHKKEKIWKKIIDGMINAGFEKMLIFQSGQEIILFEEAKDLKKAYEYYDDDDASQKWDKMIAGWMESYPHYDEVKGDIVFEEVPVVFYYEKGMLLH
jgi:L-rhamnose mutarotase